MARGYHDFNAIINQRLNELRRYVDTRPLFLGGIATSGGGSQGRPTGYIGTLAQTRVSYDKSELALSGTAAGSPSLLDNLNHIRYRIQVLETTSGTGSGTFVVKEGDVLVASGISILDFNSGFSVTQSPTGEANITVTASGAGEINTASNVNVAGVGVFKQKSGVDLQFKGINAGSSKITVTDDTGNNEIDIDLGTVNLGDLANVVGIPVVSGQSLVYQGTNWRPATISGIGGATVLNDLTDVNTAGVLDGQVIAYDSGTMTWLPTTISGIAGGGTFIGAKAYHSSNQSISDSTDTTLSFDSEYWDTDGIHDTVTNNSRLTCKTAGKYLITGRAEWTSGGTNDRVRINRIRLNGTTYIAQTVNHVASATYGSIYDIAVVYDLDVDDYVEFLVWQNSGSSRNVAASSNYSPDFSMVLLSTGGATVLNDLTDVTTSGVTNGQVIAYNSATQTWLPSGVGGGIITVKSGDSVVSTDITTIDFDGSFVVAESPSGEANVSLVSNKLSHNLIKNYPSLEGADGTAPQWFIANNGTLIETPASTEGLSGTPPNERILRMNSTSTNSQIRQLFTISNEDLLSVGTQVSFGAWVYSSGTSTTSLAFYDITNTTTVKTASTTTYGEWVWLEFTTTIPTGCASFYIWGANNTNPITWYMANLSFNTGPAVVPFKPRGLTPRIYTGTTGPVASVDPAGGGWTDADFTSYTSANTVLLHIHVSYVNSTTNNEKIYVQMNGIGGTGNFRNEAVRNRDTSNLWSNSLTVMCDDSQIIEYDSSAVAGDTEELYITCPTYWEWE